MLSKFLADNAKKLKACIKCNLEKNSAAMKPKDETGPLVILFQPESYLI